MFPSLRNISRSFSSALPAVAVFPALNTPHQVERRWKKSMEHSSSPTFSGKMLGRLSRGLLSEIDLLVCDMAGTTIEEGGVVYEVLRKSMNEAGLKVSKSQMHPWHGAKKEAVIEHFLRAQKHHDLYDLYDDDGEELLVQTIEQIGNSFLAKIDEAYFDEASPVEHIDLTLISYFRQLQSAGIKIALDTGYPPEIQMGLMKKMQFDVVVDSHISAYQVKQGRPYPYMIFRLMENLDILNVKRVAKAGDSVRDVEEGRNAGCGLVIGVLSGADNEEQLLTAGADVVVPRITDIPVPFATPNLPMTMRPDFS